MSADAPGIFRGKHLVVFGAGYVGGEVARQAVVAGLRVTALTRNVATVADLAALGVNAVAADLAGDTWHRQIGAADLVLNCVSSGGGGLAGYQRSYVDGMRSILTWAARVGGVDTTVYTSSTSVYPQSGGAIVDENASTEGAGERGRLLLETEHLLRAAESARRRWFVLRLAGIYGPGRHHLLDQLRSGAREIAGRGEHRLNLIHRDDVASAIWSAFSTTPTVANEIFNVADDGAATKAEVIDWLARVLGRPASRFSGAVVSARRAATPDRVISNAKIKAWLGWRPRYGDYRAGYRAILEA